MNLLGTLFVLFCTSGCWALPLTQEGAIPDKRTLEDPPLNLQLGPGPYNPFLTPYGIYPGIKPLRPIPPGLFLNRFATPAPLSPISALFKSKKDEFLNALFDQLSLATDVPDIEVRSLVDGTEAEDDTEVAATTPKPKIDPSEFITKKFDFLSKLFKAINSTTTPAPTVEGETTDPLATTVKPTIVPPGFWVPAFLPPKPPKTPKPPKATKAPKPGKAKATLLDAIDEALLKSLLQDLDPTNTALTGSDKTARKISFLDALLHRETTPEPSVADVTDSGASADASNPEARSLLFPPGYWIPPYIYAAKMGIYLDKMFDTINSAAASDAPDDTVAAKRSLDSTNASLLLINELSKLKNDLLTTFSETSVKVAPTTGKLPVKSFKKFWGPKTTPAPDPAQKRIELLSEVFDKLAEVELALLNGQDLQEVLPTQAATAGVPLRATVEPPSFWAPDPTTADIGAFYKDKTQEFLGQLFDGKDTSA